MWISNGGRVENTDGSIGAVAGSLGTVDVRSGGTWDNSGSLYVGGKFSAGGFGYLDVDVGRVDVANLLKVYPDGTISLHQGEIHIGAGGFQIDGGTLIGTGEGIIVMTGGGNVQNHGHVSIPWYGGTPDPLVITGGDYAQDPGGVLSIMIGGTELSEYGKLEIDSGTAFLDGTVEVQPINLGGGTYTPSAGDRFDILAATGGLVGTEFATLSAPTPPGLAWDIDYGANVVSLGVFLDADFDHDGDIDGHDLLVWQRGVGTANPKHQDGDADGDHDVDGADLASWKLGFGSIAPVVPAGTAVPEPTGLVLALIATFGLGGFRHPRQ